MSTENKGFLSNIKSKVSSFLTINYPTQFYKPYMLKDEFNLLKRATNNDKTILEFGAGGSTIYFLKKHKNVYTVENNEPFVAFLKKMNFFNKNITSGKLHFLYINTGQTTGWGKPVNDELKESWISYATSIWNVIPKDVKIDTVFIDGRFRVLTTLYSILNTPADTKIIIHDFNERPQYKIVLDFLDPVETSSQLVIFKKKPVNELKIKSLIDTYKYDYR